MRVFASLHSDAQQGWVWLDQPDLEPRSIVRIRNRASGESVFCEALQIDTNFLKTYNQAPRCSICDTRSAIVMNSWYRAKLGQLRTRSEADLHVEPAPHWLSKFKACTHHPQVIVRVAAWLGLISVLLGFIGVVLGAMSLRGSA